MTREGIFETKTRGDMNNYLVKTTYSLTETNSTRQAKKK